MRKDDKISLDNLRQETELYEHPLTDKQRDILKAAEKLFSEHGFSDTPTASIAKEAGVTEKTLFKHFPTKADLLKRVMFPLILKFVLPTQIKHLKTLIQNAGHNPEDIFKTLMRDRIKLSEQFHGKLKFMLMELLKSDSLRAQVFKIWHDQLWIEMTNLIEVLKEEGKIRKDLDTAMVGRTMISIIMAYVLSVQLSDNKWDHEKNIDQLTKILMNGVSA